MDGYETAQEDVEMEADIYSMEHQDNVEEFKTKGEILLSQTLFQIFLF